MSITEMNGYSRGMSVAADMALKFFREKLIYWERR